MGCTETSWVWWAQAKACEEVVRVRGVQAAWLDDLTWWLDQNSGLTWLDRDLTWNKFFPLTWLETWLDLKKAGLNTYRGVQAGLIWWLDLMTWLNSALTWLDHDLTWQNFWALDLTWGLTWLEKSDLNTPSSIYLPIAPPEGGGGGAVEEEEQAEGDQGEHFHPWNSQ